MTLFDQPFVEGPYETVKADHLGEIRACVATESGFSIFCKLGQIELSNEQFESLRRTLTPTRKATP
jgi:hypothetical protein